jgi:hypothetical protein
MITRFPSNFEKSSHDFLRGGGNLRFCCKKTFIPLFWFLAFSTQSLVGWGNVRIYVEIEQEKYLLAVPRPEHPKA